MPDGSDGLLARTVAAIDEIPAKQWDALANPPGEPANPFCLPRLFVRPGTLRLCCAGNRLAAHAPHP